jgi:hypothetical protein
MANARARSRRWWRQMVTKHEAVRGEVGLWEFAEEQGVNRSTLAWWASYFRRQEKTKGESRAGALLPVVVSGAERAQQCGPGLPLRHPAGGLLQVRTRLHGLASADQPIPTVGGIVRGEIPGVVLVRAQARSARYGNKDTTPRSHGASSRRHPALPQMGQRPSRTAEKSTPMRFIASAYSPTSE